MSKRLFSIESGALATIFFVLSPLALNIGREIRFYEFFAFLFILLSFSIFKFINSFEYKGKKIKRYLENKKNVAWAIITLILFILSYDNHIITLVLSLPIILYLIILWLYSKEKKYGFLLITLIILFLIGNLLFFKSLNLIENLIGITHIGWVDFYKNYANYWFYPSLIINQIPPILFFLGIVSLIFSFLTLDIHKKRIGFFSLVIIIPLIYLSFSKLEIDRYAYFTLPIFLILISFGITNYYHILKKRVYKIIFIAFIIFSLASMIIEIEDVKANREKFPTQWGYTLDHNSAINTIKEIYTEDTIVIVDHFSYFLYLYKIPINYTLIDKDIYFIQESVKFYPNKEDYNKDIYLGTKFIFPESLYSITNKNKKVIILLRPRVDITKDTYDTIKKLGFKRINSKSMYSIFLLDSSKAE